MKTKYPLLFLLLSLILGACIPAWRLGTGPDLSGVVATGSVSIVSATASPSSVTYPSGCGTMFSPPVDITFTVLVNDPSGIGSEHYDVRIWFGFGYLPSPGEYFLLAQAGTTGTVYTYSDDTNSNLDQTREPMNRAFKTGTSGVFLWQATVVNESLKELAKTPVMEIPFSPGPGPCPTLIIGPGPHPIVPSPASAADCPAGTYFADATHQCIPIQIVPTNPGGGPPSCSVQPNNPNCKP